MNGASTAAEGSHVIKLSAGYLYSVYATVSSASSPAGYIMVFDATTVPADGAVTPAIVEPIPGTGNSSFPCKWTIDFGSYPAYFSNGIVVVFSTTGPYTKTESATAYFQWAYQ